MTLSLQSFKLFVFKKNENQSKPLTNEARVLCGSADDVRAQIPEGLRFSEPARGECQKSRLTAVGNAARQNGDIGNTPSVIITDD